MNQAEVLKTAMKHIDRALNELDTVCPYYSNDYEALHRAKKALRQALAQISPSDYALIHKDALRAWDKLGELEAACCYSMQPEQEPSKQFNEWACAEHQKILAESANSTTSVVESKALAQPKQKYDYRVKYDRPCYKCRSNFCPGNCKEPKYLAQPEQRPVGTYEGVMETMLSLRKGTLEQQQIYTHMKDKLLYTAPPKREWVGLTDEQRAVLNFMLGADELDGVWFGDRHPKEKDSFWWRNRLRNAFQDADIEAKLKEKNT